MTDDILKVERRSDRVVATLDRPSTRNAIDQDMVDAFHALCGELEADPRVLIITGANGVFASGADIRQLRDRRRNDALRGINSEAFIRINALPMPVIAAIDGYALGGGAELAYAADVRIGTPELKIGNPEVGLGIIAAAGASWRLPQIVGEPLALQLLLTGDILDGRQALEAGIVTALHDRDELMTAAHSLADRMLRNDPAALMATKRIVRAPRAEHPRVDMDEQAVLFESPEKMRRMTEFLERKKTK